MAVTAAVTAATEQAVVTAEVSATPPPKARGQTSLQRLWSLEKHEESPLGERSDPQDLTGARGPG